MFAIFKKELKIYFGSLFGYLFLALHLLFSGVLVTLMHLLSALTDYSMTLVPMQWVLLILIPFLSMRSIAQERNNRTDLLLYSLPLRLSDVVMGKFLAQAALFLPALLPLAVYPMILATMGGMDLAAAYVALLGYALMGLAMIALCTFLSSLFESQVVAAIVSIASLLALYFLSSLLVLLPTAPLFSFVVCLIVAAGVGALMWRATKNIALGLSLAAILITAVSVTFIVAQRVFDNLVARFLNAINLFTRLGGFTYGRLDLPATVFYLTFIGVFIFLTVQVMEKRRRV